MNTVDCRSVNMSLTNWTNQLIRGVYPTKIKRLSTEAIFPTDFLWYSWAYSIMLCSEHEHPRPTTHSTIDKSYLHMMSYNNSESSAILTMNFHNFCEHNVSLHKVMPTGMSLYQMEHHSILYSRLCTITTTKGQLHGALRILMAIGRESKLPKVLC